MNPPDLKHFFFRTLMDWLSVLQNQSFSSLFIFLDSYNFYSWLLTPVHSLCTRVSFFFISIKLITYIKKKKYSWIQWTNLIEIIERPQLTYSSRHLNNPKIPMISLVKLLFAFQTLQTIVSNKNTISHFSSFHHSSCLINLEWKLVQCQ